MSYDMRAHRAAERDQCLRMLGAGPGWHPYVVDRAEALIKSDPHLHEGLFEAIEARIGVDAVKAARKDAARLNPVNTQRNHERKTR